MKAEFWHQRWQPETMGLSGLIASSHMTRFIDLLGIEQGDNVLVPLCGKSLDMIWLRDKNFRVTGIEISPIAVADIFAENKIEHEISDYAWGKAYRSENLDILCADFFDISPSDLPHTDGIYDRASLIALPESMRPDYAKHRASPTAGLSVGFLITLDYPQQEMDGPPFSVSERDVDQLFSELFIIEPIYSEDCLVNEPRFQAKGLTRLDERVFLLTKNIP